MKCIYCNKEENLSVSDIIPFALTGAKVKKKFVCREHNCFTNDNYEKTWIKNLAFFRNLLDLTERDGDPVRFDAEVQIGEYTIKKAKISDKCSLLESKKLLRGENKAGKMSLLGDKEKLAKIANADVGKISTVDQSEITIVKKSDIRELFISSEALHSVAKIIMVS